MWRKRSRRPVPETAEQAVTLARTNGLAPTYKITVRKVAGEKFDRIINYELGNIPGTTNSTNSLDEGNTFSAGFVTLRQILSRLNENEFEEETPW